MNKLFAKKNIMFVLKWFAQIALFIFSLGILAISILFFNLSTQLPDPHKLIERDVAQSTKIYDRNDKLLYEVHGDVQRTLVTIDQIPKHLKEAVITTEDRDFYQHMGFDPKRLIGAAVQNLLNRDIYGQGASTITQQLVKNAILSTEKTYDRKIKELILSIELEQIFTKDEILQIYLNEIPFGSTAYGVQAASELYFDKNIQDLTIAEGAVLAAIIQAPSYYSPYGNHTDELSERHHWILEQMHELGYIDEQQMNDAIAEQIQFKQRKQDIEAPHFVFYVLEKLEEKYTQQEIEEGGFKITTTLDLDKQNKAQELVTKYADQNRSTYNASNAALVSLDPRNGQIIAMVGSRDYWDTDNDGNVNVVTSERQPGSSFKPLVYAMGFEDKWFPGSTLYDVKTSFGGSYTPDNYDKSFRGPVTIRSALQNSLNIPAVKMLDLVGLDKVIEKSNQMGIASFDDPERYGLSLVLGGGEIKLLELAGAYASLANQGKFNQVTPILKIEDSSGKIIEQFDEEQVKKNAKEVLKIETAYLISNVLSDNASRAGTFGTNSDLFIPGHSVAAKTGTTDEYRDGWTVGYTPSIVTGVWAGNNDNTPMNNAPGIYVAAPLWNEYMHFILDGTDNEEFSKPDTIANVTVDRYSNGKPVAGSDTITDLGAPWHQPTESPKGVTVYRVCKSNGKLADSGIPEDLTEQKTFREIHSEKPDDPNWEKPVLGWAAGAGLSTPPPTEKCTLDEVRPSISIVNPASGSTVKNNINITTSINSPSGVKKVDFYFDGGFIGSSSSEPFSLPYNLSSAVNGEHFISVNLTATNDLTASGSVTFQVSNTADQDPPIVVFVTPVNNSNIAQSSFPVSIQINAIDNDSGVNRVEFKVDSSPLGTISSPSGSTYGITWPYPGTGNYTLKAIAFDNEGNSTAQSINIVVTN